MKIKICGLFRDCDIDFVNEAMPDYIGFVFAESKRKIDVKTAEKFRKAIDPGIISVGVFVNAPVPEIAELYQNGVINIAQLHGSEDKKYIADLKKMCGVPVIKAFSVGAGDGTFPDVTNADFLLFDNGAGGTGKNFDWEKIPGTDEKKFFLAGGISPDNIREAMKHNPYCIDVSSGAETDGVKDRAKIIELVNIAKTHC